MKIGDLMRRTRQEAGLSLGQVAKELYIQEKYIQALEEGNYEIIPGEVFMRAYFWQYAEYLGLKEYIESISSPPLPEIEEKEPQQMNEIFGGVWDTPRIARVALKIGLPILIIVLIVMGVQAKRNRPEGEPEPERVSGTHQTLQVVPTETAQPSWEIPSNVGSGSGGNLDDMAHEVTLTALGQCWITVETRDGSLYNGMMTAGEVLSFTDLIGFHIRAGAPEKLEVEFDGELVPWEPGQNEMLLPPGAAIFPDDDQNGDTEDAGSTGTENPSDDSGDDPDSAEESGTNG